MIRRFCNVCVALAVLAAVVLAAPAPIARAAEPEDELSQVQQKEDQKQAELDAAKVADEDLEREISALSDQITAQRPRVREAKARLDTANAKLKDAEERLASKEAELRGAQSSLDQRAVALYKTASIGGDAEAVIGAENLNQAEVRLSSLRSLVRDDQRVVDSLTAAKQDLEEERRAVAEKQAAASDAHEAQQAELKRLSKLDAAKKASEKELAKRIKDLDSEVQALQEQEAKIQATIAEKAGIADAALVGRSRAPSKKGLIWPTQGTLTSHFGMRWGRLHAGIDIACSTGTPIVAAATGQVISAGWSGGYGNYTLIAHGGGISTGYGHQSRIAVSEGQVVNRGDVIGYVGSTGHSTGPHLHFEVRVNGSPTDPLEWL